MSRSPRHDLALRFSLDADLAELRIPPPTPPHIAHDLWHHTCFEAFVATEETAAYHELNFSPSGAWGAFAFRGYRDGTPLGDEALAPRIVVQRDHDRLVLEATVSLARLSPAYATSALRLALAAVVEDASGALAYWALHHPPGTPDFHHPDAFVLRLEPPGGAC